MSIDFAEKANSKIYIYSLISVIIGELLIFFLKYTFEAGSLIKIFVHSYIYISIFFLIYSFNLSDLQKFNSQFFKFILLILVFYSLIQFFRPSPEDTELYVSNPIYARFGNIWYGPMFLIPFFIIWGLNKDSIYWFEKISINMVKIGIVIFLFSIVLNFRVPYVFFLSSFCLLAGFSYSDIRRKRWIIAGLIVSVIVFYMENYRAGILRIIISLLCIYIATTNINVIKKLFILFLFIGPFIITYDVLFNYPNIFQTLSQLNFQIESNFFVDTRTLLFQETFFELEKKNSLLFGLG